MSAFSTIQIFVGVRVSVWHAGLFMQVLLNILSKFKEKRVGMGKQEKQGYFKFKYKYNNVCGCT